MVYGYKSGEVHFRLKHGLNPAPLIKDSYNDLTICVESVAKLTSCFFPNPNIQDFFIDIHLKYFQNCTNENDPMTEDAPQEVVIGLTLLSVSFIPIMVYLVARS
uniref:Uncharacterized protein n=2 Tax=Oreochromis TaxID=8139 RepID=I3KNW0_ORENI